MQYSGEIGTAHAGQPALPSQQAQYSFGVLGQTTTVKSKIVGHSAILTKHGLAWVTVRATDLGQVRVSVDSVGSRVHLHSTSGMRAVFGLSI